MSSIKQKLKTSIIILVFIIILVALIYFIYEKLDYTLSEVEELLNSPKSTSNMHVVIDGIENNESTYTEIFMKDSFYYVIYKTNKSANISQECYYRLMLTKNRKVFWKHQVAQRKIYLF